MKTPIPAAEVQDPPRPPVATAPFVALLQRGDEDAWRRLLTEQHAVFERAVRIAVRRAGAGLDGSDPALVDEAKVYFYEAFRRGFRGFDGEGQFFAWLYRTVLNFVREHARSRRHGAAGSASTADAEDEDAEGGGHARRAVSQWRQDQRSLDPALEARLSHCLLLLPGAYRSVVLMHHFEPEQQTLQSLAQVLGATVDAIHKRYQRAIAMLRECLTQARSESHAS